MNATLALISTSTDYDQVSHTKRNLEEGEMQKHSKQTVLFPSRNVHLKHSVGLLYDGQGGKREGGMGGKLNYIHYYARP